MKYFDIKSLEHLEHQEAMEKWRLMTDKYHDYFETISGNFSKSYLDTYNKNDHFHDFNLVNINCHYKKWNDLQISLIVNFRDERKYDIIHSNVKKCEVNLPFCENFLIWLYDEYEYDHQNKLWIHRIVFTDYNEISITSKNIIAKKSKNM